MMTWAHVIGTLLLVAALVQPAVQRGTLFADRVEGATQEYSHIRTISSEEQVIGTIDFGDAYVSDPDGVHADAPGAFSVQSSSFQATGYTGARIEAATWTVTSQLFTTQAESTVGEFTGDVTVSIEDDGEDLGSEGFVEFLSGHELVLRGQRTEVEGLWGVEMEATDGAADISAANAVDVVADELRVLASLDVHFESSAGDLFFDGTTDVSISAINIDMNAHTFSQLASKEDLTMRAAGAVHSHSGTALIAGVEDVRLFSEKQSISVTAATTIDLESRDGDVVFNAPAIAVRSEEDSASGIVFKGDGGILFNGTAMHFSAPDFSVNTPEDLELRYETLSLDVQFTLQVGSPLAHDGVTIDTDNVTLSGTQRAFLEAEQDIFIDAPAVLFAADNDVDDSGLLVFTAGENILADVQATTIVSGGEIRFISEGLGNAVSLFDGDIEDVVITADSGTVVLEGRAVSVSVEDTLTFEAPEFTWSTRNMDISFEDLFVQDPSGGSGIGFELKAANDLDVDANDFLWETGADLDFVAEGVLSVRGQWSLDSASFGMSSGADLNADSKDFVVEDYASVTLEALRGNVIQSSLFDFTGPDRDAWFNAERSLIVDDTQLFTAVADGADISVTAADDYTLHGGDRVLIDTAVLRQRSQSARWFTDTSSGGGVLLQSGEEMTVNATGNVHINSPELVSLRSEGVATFRATQSASFTGDQGVDIDVPQGGSDVTSGDTTLFYADGHLQMRANDSFVGSAGDDVLITGEIGNVEWRTANTAQLIATDGYVSATGGSVSLYGTGNFEATFAGEISMEATTAGEHIFIFGGDVVLNTAYAQAQQAINIRSSVGLGSQIHFTDPDVFEALASDVLELGGEFVRGVGERELHIFTSNGVSMDGSEFGARDSDVRSTEEEIRLYSSTGQYLISDLDMAVRANLTIQALTNDLLLEGVDHVTLRGQGIDIEAFDTVDGNIAVTSGGALTMRAPTGTVRFDSANDIVTDTGGALHLRALHRQFRIRALEGNEANIRFQTEGTLDMEATKTVRIETTGENADIVIKLGDVISSVSDEAGVSLRSEGLVIGAEASGRVADEPGILVDTYDNGGNIFLKADRAHVVLNGFEGVSLEAQRATGQVDGLYGVDVKTGGDLALTSESGFAEINGGRGLYVKAGQEPDTGKIRVEAVKRATFIAEDRISIRSEGEVADYGIQVKSRAGDIRLSTSNGKDIQSDANFNMFFDIGGDMLVEATGDVDVLTYGGTTSLVGGGGIEVSSEGGPVIFETRSGSGGEVLFESTDGSATISAGGVLRMEAESSIDLRSVRGFDVEVGEARIDVAAESTESTIHFLAGGSLFVHSNDEEAGVTFEAANNMEVNAENLVSINSVQTFTVGERTRPLVRVNAGGSATQEGFSVLSEGTARVSTQRVFDVNVEVDVDVDGDSGVYAQAGGPMLVKSTAGDIKWEATRGSVNFTSLRANVQGEQSIEMRAGTKLYLTEQGRGTGDRVEIDAYRVLFESASMDALVEELNVLASDSVDIAVEGRGVVRNSQALEGSIRIVAADDFTALANGEMRFETQNRRGPQVFEAVGSGSSLTIETLQANSHVLFDASGQASAAAGGALSLTAFESGGTGIVIESVTNPNNDEPSKSDVQIYASRDGDFRSDGRVEMTATGPIVVTASDVDAAGVGGPIRFSSSRNFEVDAATGAVFSTEDGEGGNMQLYAFDDMFFGTELNSGGRLEFQPDLDLTITAQHEIVLEGAGAWTGDVRGEAEFVAHGHLTGIEEEAVVLQSVDTLHFSAARGSVLLDAFNDLFLTMDGDVEARSLIDGAVGSVAADLYVYSLEGSALLAARNGPVQMRNAGDTAVVAVEDFTVTAAGVENNRLWAARFASDTQIELEAATSSIGAGEGIEWRAGTLDWSFNQMSVGGSFDQNYESAGTTRFTANAFTASAEMVEMGSAGSVSLGADSTTMNSDRIELRTPADAADSNVSAFAAGTMSIEADYASFRATGPEGANGLVHATGGRLRIAGSQAPFGVSVVAEEGDVLVRSAELRPVVLDAGRDILVSHNGEVVAVGRATEPNQPLGVSFTSDNLDISSIQDEVAFTANDVLFSLETIDIAPLTDEFGGPTTFSAQEDLSFTGEGITMSAASGSITLRANKPDNTNAAPQSGIQFFPNGDRTQARTSMSDDSRFLIPFTSTEIVQGDACDEPRQLLYSVGERTTSHLCVCNPYNAGSDTLAATPRWDCVDFVLQ